MKILTELLNHFEKIIDVDRIIRNEHELEACLRFEKISRPIFAAAYAQEEYTPFPIPEIHADMEKMLYNELLGCLPSFEESDGGIPMIRANYGVGTLASLFGMESYFTGNDMPWVRHVKSTDAIRGLISRGVPNLKTGFGARVLETYEYYMDVLSKYENLYNGIKLYHADLQGVFDTAHLIAGPEIYTLMYDEPELIHNLLKLVAQTYIAYLKEHFKIADGLTADGNCYHWGSVYGGAVLIRNDSAVNLSPAMYKEFIRPYDEEILSAFGGGTIHFCGRADQWIFDMIKTKNLKTLNFGWMGKYEFGQNYLDFLKQALDDSHISVGGYTITTADIETFDFKKYSTGVHFKIAAENKRETMDILDR